MLTVAAAEGALLERILDEGGLPAAAGLGRRAYGRLDTALARTPWGRVHRRRVALLEGREWRAAATEYDLAAVLDGRAIRACGIADVVTAPAEGTHDGAAAALVERLAGRCAQEGAELALLFSHRDPAWCADRGFTRLPTALLDLAVAESPRHGAPMTLVRGGEESDLPAIAAIGQARAARFRFHLDRGVDFVRYAITAKRLRSGLGAAGEHELHFFVAEEGITAAAYVVLSVRGGAWTIEECGDRDEAGARVGAMLQALIARDPSARRPSIRGWLPPGFRPPQVAATPLPPGTAVLMARFLGPRLPTPPLGPDDVLFWRGDLF
jgi:hypothetical protein